MIILISNDDGISSPGLRALAQAVKKNPRAEVYVVAPDRERSAASHSLTIHRPLKINKISKNTYTVDGTPTDCVTLAVSQILKCKPDLVLSGINKGANLGDDVHYSGTVSAAVEAVIGGVPAIAFSLVAKEKFLFKPAAEFAAKLTWQVLKEGLPKGNLLNVNFPNLPQHAVKGYRFTKIGKRNYGDIIISRLDPRGRPYYWIGGEQNSFIDIPNSDCNAIAEGYISITPLKVDMTDHAYLKKIQNWKI